MVSYTKRLKFLVLQLLLAAAVLFSLPASGQTFEICNDGVDNDGDGLIDCNDSDCQFAPNIERGCNCFDGIDNDGDGKTDASDTNCYGYLGLSFVGNGADCSITPDTDGNVFNLVSPAVSGQNTVDTQSKVAIGDVDFDGIPDVVASSKWNGELRVVATKTHSIDGKNFSAGDIKSDFKVTGNTGAIPFRGADVTGTTVPKSNGCYPQNLVFEHELLIADIDPTTDVTPRRSAEIFAVISNRGGNPESPPECFYLAAFDYVVDDLVLKWFVRLGSDRPGIPGITDFDGDGKSEIYLKNRIYAAESGVLLADGGGNWDTQVNSAPSAVNITGDSKQELICGNIIYNVPSLATRTLQTLTVFKDMNLIPGLPASKIYYPKVYNDPVEYGIDNHSSTAIGDIDNDGNIDIFLSGSVNSTTGQTAVFYWNQFKNTVSVYIPVDPDPLLNLGWPWGTGRINLADADGDAKLNVNFIAGNQLFSLKEDASGNLISNWTTSRTINDSRSGVVTCTVYDFDNDNKPEIVYRDSQEIAIVDGATGQTKKWSSSCQSHTFTEGPIIADVDDNGSTDICVPCFRGPGNFGILGGLQQQALGEVRLFYSDANDWLPTRQVWNQPGYFVVNINDDLSVPRTQLDPNTTFSSGSCANGKVGPQKPLNMFINQVPTMGPDGCPFYPAPDLAFNGDDPAQPGVDTNLDGKLFSVATVIPPVCGDVQVGVYFNFINNGDLPLSDNVPVSFFAGDPTANPPGVRLFNTTLDINNLAVLENRQTSTITFNGPSNEYTLYIMLYNDGSVLPIDLGASSKVECTVSNNLYSIDVVPRPFDVTVENLSDNNKCSPTDPNVGALRAKIFKNGTELTDYSEFTFQWYEDAAGTIPIAGADQYNITGLDAGDYYVVVTDQVNQCGSVPSRGDIVTSQPNPDISVSLNSQQTNCSPPNGQLAVSVAGGNTGYTFAWFDSNLNPLGITGAVASNLVAGNYIAQVSTGSCSFISETATIEGPVLPDVLATATPVVDCSNPESGTVSATALLINTNTGNIEAQPPAGFTFNWFQFTPGTPGVRGSPLPGSGPDRSGLRAGFYQVEVIQTSSGCASGDDFVVQVESDEVIPEAIISEVQAQTSCDPSDPNGILQGSVQFAGVAQDPSQFTFEWFRGSNTLAANSHTIVSGVNGSTAEEVSGGGVPYTLRVTTALNCSGTAELSVSESLVAPEITVVNTEPNRICDATLGSASPTGELTVTQADGSPLSNLGGFEVKWYRGTTIAGAEITNSGSDPVVLGGLEDGYYTVVVILNSTKCQSLPFTVEVTEEISIPVIELGATGSTNCAPAVSGNGSVTVSSVNGSADLSGYSFEWYSGATAGAPNAGTAGVSVANLQGGTGIFYTVRGTNATDGCQNTATVSLADESEVPVITLTPADNSICDPALTVPSVQFNGSVSSVVSNLVAGSYSYEWYSGSVASGTPLSDTDEVLNNVNTGDYTAVATHEPTGCKSVAVTSQVGSTTVLPTVVADGVGSTNCVPGLEDGSVRVTGINGTTDASGFTTDPLGFTISWFTGTTTAGTSVPGVLPTGLQGGDGVSFTALITNLADGCQNTATVSLADESEVPVITLTPADNSICDPALTVPSVQFNGSVSSVVSNLVAGAYSYEWYSGSVASGTPLSDTDEVLNNVNTGDYTAVATHEPTGCKSVAVTSQVGSTTVLPTVVADGVGSTNCVPGLEDGSVRVTGINGTTDASGFTTDPLGFTISWFTGTTTAGTSVPGVLPTGLQGGDGVSFTALITNLADGCQNTATVSLADESEVPVITLTPADNSICDPALTVPSVQFNGSVSSVVSNLVAGAYSYEWYSGSVASGTPLSDTDEVLNNVNTGDYTAVATHEPTGCKSVAVTSQVGSTTVLPTVVADGVGSTNCVPGLEDGSVRVTGINGTTDASGFTTDPLGFTISWFTGTTTAGTSVPGVLPTGLQGGDGVSFTALITNLTDGCQNTATVSLADESEVPVITLTPADNSICDPALTVPSVQFNGSVSSVVSNLVAGAYSYEWYSGSVASGTPLSDTDEVLNNVNTGDYTAVATHEPTGCKSVAVTSQVGSTTVLPTVVADGVGSTNCVPGLEDGSVRVTGINGTTDASGFTTDPLGFTISWFTGTTTAGTSVPGVLPTGLQGGDGVSFTALITNLTDGCQNTATVSLADESEVPVITLTPADNSICDPALTVPSVQFNGSVSSVVSNLVAGSYSYEWYSGSVASGTPLSDTDEVLNNVNTGDYTAVATHEPTGCKSVAVTSQVGSTTVLPTVVADGVGSTNCVPGLEDGSVRVTGINGTTDASGFTTDPLGFTISWFTGTTTAGTSVPGVLPTGLQGGDGVSFTALITNLTDGCQNTATVSLADESEVPVITLTPADNSICDPALTVPSVQFNGSVSSVVSNLVAGAYSYEWYSGSVASGTPLSDTDEVLNNVNTGDYTAVATHEPTGCKSVAVTSQVGSTTVLPTVVADGVGSTNCVPGLEDGSVRVTGINGTTDASGFTTDPLGFTISWFTGTTTAGTSVPGVLPTGLQGGDGVSFTALITNLTDGCQNTATVSLADESEVPVITLTPADNSICDPALTVPSVQFNGSVSSVVSNLVAGSYSYEWYSGSVASGTPLSDTDEVLNNVNTGDYTAVATHEPTGCKSVAVTSQVGSTTVLPTVVADGVGSTNCVPGLEDGSVRVTGINGTTDASGFTTDPLGFTISWFTGTTTAGTSVPGVLPTGLQGGDGVSFTALITNLADGCQNTATVSLADESEVPVITLTPADNSICDPALTVPSVQFNGSVSSVVSNLVAGAYSYEWYSGSVASGTPLSDTDEVLNNVNTGDYTAVATHEPTGCKSVAVTSQVGSTTVLPTVVADGVGSTNCVPGLEDGSVRVTGINGTTDASGFTTDPLGFTISWFTGTTTAGTSVPGVLPTGLQGGDGVSFTALITNLADGCQNTATVSLADESEVPVITLTPADNSICDPALTVPSVQFNGSVSSVVSNLVAGAYSYEWYSGSVASGTPLSDTDEVLNNVNTGDYTAVATHEPTGCKSVAVTSQVGSTTVLPTVVADGVGSTNCVPGLEDGSVRVTGINGTTDASGFTTDPLGFTISWFTGTTTAGTSVPGVLPTGLQGGDGVSFTALITNLTDGCQNTATVSLADESEVPVITLTPADNSICDPALTVPSVQFNGSVSSVVSNLVAGAYSYEWYSGSVASGTPLSDTDEVLNNVNTGDYTAVATHEPTGCKSVAVTSQVGSTTVLPTVVADGVGSTNCVPGLEDGSVRVTGINGTTDASGFTTDPLGFTISWFTGTTTAGTSVPGVLPTGLQGGDGVSFTALITNLADGCQNTTTVSLPDNSLIPVLILTPGFNDICDPLLATALITPDFSGSISANVSNNDPLRGNTYTYEWYEGPTASGTDFGDQDGALNPAEVFEGLDSGDYTAVVESDKGCRSVPVSTTVTDNTALPSLVADAVGSTNCDPDPIFRNGSVRVTAINLLENLNGFSNNPTDFEISWFEGSTTSGPSVTGVLPDNLQGGDNVSYTVQVTDLTDGCRNTTTVSLPDQRQLPAVTIVPVANDVCDKTAIEAGNPQIFSGTATAGITNIPVGEGTDDYNFSWSNGLSGDNLTSINDLDAGSYTLQVVHNTTGCVADPVVFQIEDNTVLPVVQTDSNPSTNCPGGTPDGAAFVTNPAPDFRYRWFDGVGTGGTLRVGETDEIIDSNVQGGFTGAQPISYTVEVTIATTGCRTVAVIPVADNSELPEILTVNTTDDTFCVGGDGLATVTSFNYKGAGILSPFAGFEFSWTVPLSGTLASTGNIINAGTYSVSVKNILDNCESNPFSFTINSNLTFPVIDTEADPQVSCDKTPAQLTGEVRASVGGTTVNHTYLWSTSPAFASALSNTAIASNLEGNTTYFIRATDNITGCASEDSQFVPEILTFPELTVTSPADHTQCEPPDGSIQATITSNFVATSTYSYYFIREVPPQITGLASDLVNRVENAPLTSFDDSDLNQNVNTILYPELPFGNYTVTVKNDETSCFAQPVTQQVVDSRVFPPPPAINVRPADCLDNGGVLEISNPNPLESYDVAVYRGGPTNPVTPIDFFTNPPVYSAGPIFTGSGNSSTVSNLTSDIYSIEIKDALGCKNLSVTFLPFTDAPGIEKTIYDSRLCDPSSGNGVIRDIRAIPPPSDPELSQNWFTFSIRSGAGSNGPLITPAFTLPPQPPGLVPTFESSCANGIDDDGDGDTDASDGDCNSTFSSLPNLKPGFYTIEVQENISNPAGGCKVYDVIEIKSISLPPVISLDNIISPNTNCDPAVFSGNIPVSVDKNPLDTNPDDYRFELSRNSVQVAPIPNGPAGVYPQSGLAPGTYVISANAIAIESFTGLNLEVNTGCVSSRIFEVPDERMFPVLSASDLQVFDAEYCDPALEQTAGAAVSGVRLDDGVTPELITDYSFRWTNGLSGQGTQINTVTDADGNTLNRAGGEEIFNNIPPLGGTVSSGTVWRGNYSVTVTKKLTGDPATGGLGCTSNPLNIVIEDNSTDPQILLTPTADTSCDPNFFEGSIQVDVTATGPGAASGYNYSWTPTGGPGQPSDLTGQPASLLFDNINNGTYTLTAFNIATGCESQLATTVTNSGLPVFSIQAAASPLTDCITPLSPFNGTAGVTLINVDGVPGILSDFSFTWENAAQVALNDGTNLNVSGFTESNAGTYFVSGIRTLNGPGLGCEAAPVAVTIEDNRTFPVLTFSTLPNTACDTSSDGAITVTATTDGLPASLYDFTWNGSLSVASTTGTSSPVSFLSEPLAGGTSGLFIGAGSYSVTATNNDNNCSTSGSVTVIDNKALPEITSILSFDQLKCDPDGSLEVTGIEVGGVPANSNDFAFTWFGSDGTTIIAGPTVNNTLFDINDDPAITSGTYFVQVTRNSGLIPGSGCPSVLKRGDILDRSESPTVSLTALPNTACDGAFDGSIALNVTDDGSFAAGAAGYTYTWTATATPAVTINGPDADGSENYTLLSDGTYTVSVENEGSGCFREVSVQLEKDTPEIEVFDLTAVNQLKCDPDGSLEVTGIEVGGAPANSNDFAFTWFGSDGTTIIAGPTVNNTLFDINDDPAITSGTYFVQVTRNSGLIPGSGCPSVLKRGDILDRSESPTVSLTALPNTACDGAFDGSIVLNVTDDGSFAAGAAGYTYTWTATATPAVTINGPDADGSENYTLLSDGTYTVSVENEGSGCFREVSVQLEKDTPEIEVFDLTAVNQLKCDPDGSLEVTGIEVGGVPANSNDFAFTWFGSDGTTIIAGPTVNNTLFDINDDPAITSGTYFVQVTRNSGLIPGSGCPSVLKRGDILDRSESPTVSLTALPNTACDGAFDGSIVLNVTDDGSFAAGAAGYTYTWTSTTPVTPADITTPADLDGTESYSGLSDGVYTVTVKNVGSGCEREVSVQLEKDTPEIEVFDLMAVNQLKCDPDGSLEVTDIQVGGVSVPSADFDDFAFTWFGSDGTTIIAGPTVNNTLFDINDDPAITSGTYFVQVTRNNGLVPGSGCPSVLKRGDILDRSESPTVSLTALPNTACDGAFDGSIALNVTDDGSFAAGAAGYTYTWTATATPAVTINGPDADGSENYTLLSDGTYTVSVENEGSGCFREVSVQLEKDTPEIEVFDLTAVNQLKCDPDGSLEVTGIEVGGAPANSNDFAFTWFGSDGTTIIAGPTVNNTLFDINDDPAITSGTYFVQVTRNSGLIPGSGCPSVLKRGDILDRSESPTVSLTALPNTACDGAFDGSIALNVTDDGSFAAGAAGYTYTWTVTATPAVTINGPDADGSEDYTLLSDGTYTVSVENEGSGCFREVSVQLEKDTPEIEVFDLTAVNQLKCDPDGSLEVTGIEVGGVPANSNDFAFTWFGSDGTTIIAGPTVNNTLFDINDDPAITSGTYFVQVTRNSGLVPGSGCPSVLKRGDILDRSESPTVSLTALPNTACDGAFDGSIVLNVTDDGSFAAGAAGYTYTWTATATPAVTINGPDADGSENYTLLSDGTYTVSVENEGSGCFREVSVQLEKDTPEIEVFDLTAVNQLKCDPDGSLEVTGIEVGGVPANSNDFAFTWFGSDGTTIIAGPTVNNTLFDINDDPAITSGTYFVQVTRNSGLISGSGCPSVLKRGDILDRSESPTVSLTALPNTACDGAFDGSIVLNVTDDGSFAAGAAGYTYTWTATATPAVTINGPDADGSENYTLLSDGTYTVSVENEGSGCFREVSVQLEKDTPEIEVFDLTAVNQLKCDPDGSLEVTGIEVGGVPANSNDFAFTWFGSDGTTIIAGPTVNNTLFDINDDPAITSGTYFVQVTRNSGLVPGSGCPSVLKRGDILDRSESPTVSLTALPNTACDGAFDGSIVLNVTDDGSFAAGAAGYTYTWTATATPAVTINGPDADGSENYTLLSDGTYTVSVENEGSGCFREVSVQLEKDTPEIEVFDLTAVNQLKCDPDGSLEVTGIEVGGVPANSNDFAFTWFGSDGTTIIAGPTVNNTLFDINDDPAITSGTYFVQVTRNSGLISGSGCPSVLKRGDILDRSESPTVSLTALPNTACDGAFDGSIVLNVTDDGSFAAGAAGYTYTWTATATPAVTINGPDADGSENYTLLSDGTYTVSVENEGSGCFREVSVQLEKDTPEIEVFDLTAVNQLKCDPDGSLEVTGIEVGGVPANSNDFAFTWFGSDGTTIIAGPTVNNTLFDINDDPAITSGTYFVQVTRNSGLVPGSGCPSVLKRGDILDRSESPTVSLTALPNTACDGAFDGSIALNVTDDGSFAAGAAGYTYTWTATATPAVTINGPDADGSENYTLLSDGTYTVSVENEGSGCFREVSVQLEKDTPEIEVFDLTAVNQLKCDPDGSLEVTGIEVGGVPANSNDFAFTWFGSDGTTIIAGPTVNNTLFDINDDPAITSGTYFVQVTRNSGLVPGSGCPSVLKRGDILDRSESPTVSLTALPNTACDGAFDGSIALNVTDDGSFAAGAAGYTYTWTVTATPAVTINGPDADGSEDYTLLSDGTYTVSVENEGSGCFREVSVQLEKDTPEIEVFDLTAVNQLKCDPDGSLEVTGIEVGGVPANSNDFAFTWFGSDGTTIIAGPTVNNTLFDINDDPAITSGTYFVQVTRNSGLISGSGCLSAPVGGTINDESKDPRATLTYTPNTSCDVTLANGTAIATATEQDSSTGAYIFSWTLNGLALPSVVNQTDLSPVSTLENAPDGAYAVTVENTNTGCVFTTGIEIDLNQNLSKPNILTLQTLDPTSCIGSGAGSGEVSVTGISIGGGAPLTGSAIEPPNFEYEWFAGSPSSPALGATGISLNAATAGTGVPAGKYYVIVKDLLTECKSEPTEAELTDESVLFPVINITQPFKQISCDPSIGTASLNATADGQTSANSDYVFTWFENLTATAPSFAAGSDVTGINAGEYSVRVDRISTGCSSDNFYIILPEQNLTGPILSSAGDERTLCVGQDGSVQVRVTNISPFALPNNDYPFPAYNFTAQLFTGSSASGLPLNSSMTPNPDAVLPGNFIETGLPQGTYTVRITDNNTKCFSDVTETVIDSRTDPEVDIRLDNPLTNCFVSEPNGQLFATADGGKIVGYSFEWFRGSAIPVVPPSIGNNNILIAQKDGSYTVKVVNQLTFCEKSRASSIPDERPVIPAPIAEKLSDQENCAPLNATGAVKASVNGEILGYTFDWFNSENPGTGATPDFTGTDYAELDAGVYAVIAEEILTGCRSLPATVTVLDKRNIPVLKYISTGSYCEDSRPAGTPGGGSVVLEFTDPSLIIDNVIWTDLNTSPEEIIPDENGIQIFELFPGRYRAEAFSPAGCSATIEAFVETQIGPFNGVSKNRDGLNDVFVIDCISNFPNNNVKIFNRSGVLVYEADGYNNTDVFFDGTGVKGVYLQGRELPEGTYFYIIDKRDGSIPVAGYIELVR